MTPIRLLVAWAQFRKGQIIPAMPASQAQALVQRGFAEYVKEAAKSPVREVMRAGRSYVTRK